MRRPASETAATVHLDADGCIRFVWDDRLHPLLALGEARVRRASSVEFAEGGWVADLAPVSGPRLGPFRLRGEALEAERRWLADHGF